MAVVIFFLASGIAHAAETPSVAGIPFEFILFALTLLGVALFHNQTFYVALTGLASISVYKIVFTGFKTGAGVSGWVSHFTHEWVILANLFALLMGLSRPAACAMSLSTTRNPPGPPSSARRGS